MSKLVVRWQIGPFGEWSHRALALSITLMRRLLPEARLVVTHQGDIRQAPDVEYHRQEPIYSHGRFLPERFDPEAHELWLENDHILWTIPEGMRRWLRRDDATLVWMVDWDYYGGYAERVGAFRACPGMFGLPPHAVMPRPPIEENGDDQAEQGHVALWLKNHPPHEIVTHAEVSAYMPNHVLLGETHDYLGTHGVHLPGLNRQWNGAGEELIQELERKWL